MQEDASFTHCRIGRSATTGTRGANLQACWLSHLFFFLSFTLSFPGASPACFARLVASPCAWACAWTCADNTIPTTCGRTNSSSPQHPAPFPLPIFLSSLEYSLCVLAKLAVSTSVTAVRLLIQILPPTMRCQSAPHELLILVLGMPRKERSRIFYARTCLPGSWEPT